MLLSLPNILTLSRIVIIPLLLASLYLPGKLASWVPLGLFVAAGITDFLDGYLARLYGQTSKLGRVLDPVADKLLVSSALVVLVGVNRSSAWALTPATIMLCREITASGLRAYPADLRVGMPVSKLAKWKTATPTFALCCLLGGPAVAQYIDALQI